MYLTYILARHSIDGYVWVRGVRRVMRGVRGGDEGGVGGEPGGGVRGVVVVVQLRVVVEGRHAVDPAAAAVHSRALAACACAANTACINATYSHRRLQHFKLFLLYLRCGYERVDAIHK